MISLQKNGLSVFPRLSVDEKRVMEQKIARYINIIVDIICGNDISLGNFSSIENIESDLMMNERIFLNTYCKKFETDLNEETVYRKLSYGGNRFISFKSKDPYEPTVTLFSIWNEMKQELAYPGSGVTGPSISAGLTFFLPDSLEGAPDEILYTNFFYWIDAFLTYEILKFFNIRDNIYTGYKNPISIICNDDITNPGFIRFFTDYYCMLFRIFDDVTNGELKENFNCVDKDVDFGWENLGGFIINLRDYNTFGIVDKEDFHILTQKDVDIRVNYDRLTYALYLAAQDPYEIPYFTIGNVLVGEDKETLEYVLNAVKKMEAGYISKEIQEGGNE